jgi:hypothetical protein
MIHSPRLFALQGTTVRVEIPATRMDLPSPEHDLGSRSRHATFHLEGFTDASRPAGKQTHHLVTDYLEGHGLSTAEQSSQADILVVRENSYGDVDHALLRAFKGREIWVINGEASLHRNYGQYRQSRVRHVPLPVMLSAIGQWLAEESIPPITEPSDRSTNTPTMSARNGNDADPRPALDVGSSVQPWILVVDDNIINRKILVRNMAGMVCGPFASTNRNNAD